MGWGEIPDCLDAACNEHIGNLLGCGGRHGDDAHEHLMELTVVLQLGDGIDGLSVLGFLHSGGHIEGRLDVQAIGLEAAVGHQSQTQLARTDEHCIRGIVITQELLDIVNQSFSLVANLGAAAIGDNGQVLAHLHLAHIQSVGQRRCGNIGRSRIRQTFQIGEITGKPLQNGLRDFHIAFHLILRSSFIDIFFYRYHFYRLYHSIPGFSRSTPHYFSQFSIVFIDTIISIF